MKIRMDRKMYAQAQRIADSKNETFSRWAFSAIARYMSTVDKPQGKYDELTRKNSVSVAVKVPVRENVSPARIRECIALTIEDHDNVESGWPFKYDRSTLDAVIQVELMLNSKCVSYCDAQVIMDKRIAERKAEIAAEEGKQKTKKGRK